MVEPCLILSITIPALLAFICYVVSKENQSKNRSDNELALEKERNKHEIIMYYLRKTDAKTLQAAVAEIMDKKFPDKQQDIDDKMKEIEQRVRELNALIGHVQTKEEPKVD